MTDCPFLFYRSVMAFTTWTAEYEKLQGMIADGTWQQAKTVTIGNRTVTYNSPAEFWETFNRIKTLAAQESGTFSRRTYARSVNI